MSTGPQDVPDWTPTGPPVPDMYNAGSGAFMAGEYVELLSKLAGNWYYLHLLTISGSAAGELQLSLGGFAPIVDLDVASTGVGPVVVPLSGLKVPAGDGVGIVSAVAQNVYWSLIYAES